MRATVVPGGLVRFLSAAALSATLAFVAGCDKQTRFTSVEPAAGTFAGGEEIEVLGANIPRGGIQVRFGNREAQPVVVESDRKLKVLTPAGDKGTTVDVFITFDDGRAFVMKNAFKYVDQTQQRQTMDKFFEKTSSKK